MGLRIRVGAAQGALRGLPIYGAEVEGRGAATLVWLRGLSGADQRRLLAAVSAAHPGATTDAGALEGAPIALMDAAAGVTASDLLRSHGQLPERAALELLGAVAMRLDAAQVARPLTARGPTPDDVVVSPAGEVAVVALGAGRAPDAPWEALEAAGGHSPALDSRADTWRLGALLYALLTGNRAPRSSSLEITHERALRRALEAAGLEPHTAELVRGWLAWRADRRPALEDALVEAAELALCLDGPTLGEWASGAVELTAALGARDAALAGAILERRDGELVRAGDAVLLVSEVVDDDSAEVAVEAVHDDTTLVADGAVADGLVAEVPDDAIGDDEPTWPPAYGSMRAAPESDTDPVETEQESQALLSDDEDAALYDDDDDDPEDGALVEEDAVTLDGDEGRPRRAATLSHP